MQASVVAAVLFWLNVGSLFAVPAVFFGSLMAARAVQFLGRHEPTEARRRLFWANVLLGVLVVQQLGFFVRGQALLVLAAATVTAIALVVAWRASAPGPA